MAKPTPQGSAGAHAGYSSFSHPCPSIKKKFHQKAIHIHKVWRQKNSKRKHLSSRYQNVFNKKKIQS